MLAALAVVLVAARATGWLAVRLGQPRIVGEMLAGILIGPTVLGAELADRVYPQATLAVLDGIGGLAVVVFAFLVGLQVRLATLRGRVGGVVTVGLVVVAAAVAAGFALAAVLDAPGLWRAAGPGGGPVPAGAHALLLGAGVTATALPVVARILQERNQLDTPLGALGIGVSVIVTPATFVVLAAASHAGDGAGDLALGVAVRLGLLLGLGAVLAWVLRPALRRWVARDPHPDLLLVALVVGALLAALATDLIGVQGLTGALLFGLAVPASPAVATAVTARLEPVVIVLGLPVLLAVSGLRTDLRPAGPETLAAVGLVLLAVVLAKGGVATVVGRAVGLSRGDAAAVGVLLTCGGLITLVVALAGRQAGLVTPATYAVLAVTAILTTAATGPLLNRVQRPPGT